VRASLPEVLADRATTALAALDDPEAATSMAAYMKTDMPFHGVKKAARTGVLRDLADEFPIATHDQYVATVQGLWAQPHREERYLAIAWARHWSRFIVPASLPLYEQVVVEGAWWDLVDDVAANLVGAVLRTDRAEVGPVLEEWIDDDHLWRRRTAILAQLKHADDTDESMLFDFCLRRAHEDEFFIRKAIGWALRQYARVAPDAVRDLVLAHRDTWSGLTFREATKHLDV